MSRQDVIRFVIGALFGYLGFLAADPLINLENKGFELTLVVLVVLLCGGAGVYFGPVISEWIANGVSVFAQRVAREVISQLHLPNLRVRREKTPKEKEEKYLNPIVVDTSALIDGRIAEVVESGFLYGTLIVPRFILAELQHIADAADALRRGRGRRGLEVLEGLKKSKHIKVVVYNGPDPKEKNADDKLLRLAKSLRGKILTTDFNLNKVATVSGIKILNINELVNALKTTMLPGELIEVKVIQEGKEKTQGVGYLQDGTMIVVENGSTFIGKTVQATVSRVLQTAAGRMIFVQTGTQKAPSLEAKN
jgi:uncharacterized protein YacL